MPTFDRNSHLIGVSLLLILVLPASLPAVDFVHEVMPILKTRCAECHAGDRREGGLTMNTRAGLLAGGESGTAVVAGDAGCDGESEQHEA